ncbi:MAG: radical SAM/SPASM domain protein, ACGX system [Lachnospiraceae bacterium]|nr:radical SAM/SPASM domain protein, ACGX system [Lachnospiraceae bacterium]
MVMQYFSFQWHITETCDQRCKHCYIFSQDVAKQPDQMSFDEMLETLSNIEDFCKTFGREPYLFLTGGDPILHPDFWELMEELNKRNISFTIMGNPFHLTEDVCKRLKEAGCVRYQLSLDGMRETHDWFRMPGSFDTTLSKIPILKKAGIRSIIMTTVSDKNIDEIPELIDTVVEHGADVFSFGRYVPSGEPGDTSNGITPERYRKFLDTCHKKYQAYEEAGVETYFNRKDHLFTLYEYEEGIFQIPEDADPEMIYGGCNCADCTITILPTGDVYACRRVAESKVGNVYTDRLADLWLKPMEEYRQFDRFTKCSKCKLLAWCRGCPAVAKGTNGSFYAEDPQCWMEV